MTPGPGSLKEIMVSDIDPVLYILMRTDLDSMNAGKAIAQGSHAANAFVKVATGKMFDEDTSKLFLNWQKSTDQGFGTVLVLGINELEMRTSVTIANKIGFVADVIHDPTYPIVDGDICHYLPLDTCGYIFGDKNNPLLVSLLGNFNLHP